MLRPCSRLVVLRVRGNSEAFLKAEISVDIRFFYGLGRFWAVMVAGNCMVRTH